jgi:hypothetical protein
MSARRRVPLTIVCAAGMAMQSAIGADFSWAPHFRTMMRLDDNIRMAVRNPEGALGFDNAADVKFKAESSTFTSELIPHVNVRRFLIGDNLDADEYSVAFNNKYKQQTYEAGLKFSYVRDSTLTSEATDTGRIEDVKDRDSITLQPSFLYSFSDRLQSDTEFLYNSVGYQDAETSGLIDYEYLQVSEQLAYSVREDLQVFVRGLVSDFGVAAIRSSTRSYSGEIGGTWNWTPTLMLAGSVGWNQSFVHSVTNTPVLISQPIPQIVVIGVPTDGSSGGLISTVSISKIFERANVKFDYSRAVSPSGRGAQSTSDDIRADAEYKWENSLTTFFDGMYEMRSAQQDSLSTIPSVNDLNRDYVEVRAGVRYQIHQEWLVSAFYRYGQRQNTNVSGPERASSNSFFLSLDYNGLPHSKLDGLE